MSTSSVYIVKPGDYLSKIAKEHGFSRWQDIYNHPSNQQFRRKRPNPNRIFAGDVIMIPSLTANLFLLPWMLPGIATPPVADAKQWTDLLKKSWLKELPPGLKTPEEILDDISKNYDLMQILKNLPPNPSTNQIEEWWKKIEPYLSPQIGDYKVSLDRETMLELLKYLKQKLKL